MRHAQRGPARQGDGRMNKILQAYGVPPPSDQGFLSAQERSSVVSRLKQFANDRKRREAARVASLGLPMDILTSPSLAKLSGLNSTRADGLPAKMSFGLDGLDGQVSPREQKQSPPVMDPSISTAEVGTQSVGLSQSVLANAASLFPDLNLDDDATPRGARLVSLPPFLAAEISRNKRFEYNHGGVVEEPKPVPSLQEPTRPVQKKKAPNTTQSEAKDKEKELLLGPDGQPLNVDSNGYVKRPGVPRSVRPSRGVQTPKWAFNTGKVTTEKTFMSDHSNDDVVQKVIANVIALAVVRNHSIVASVTTFKRTGSTEPDAEDTKYKMPVVLRTDNQFVMKVLPPVIDKPRDQMMGSPLSRVASVGDPRYSPDGISRSSPRLEGTKPNPDTIIDNEISPDSKEETIQPTKEAGRAVAISGLPESKANEPSKKIDPAQSSKTAPIVANPQTEANPRPPSADDHVTPRVKSKCFGMF